MNNLIARGWAFVLILFFISCPIFSQETQDKQDPPAATSLAIQEHEFDFGMVKEGDRITHEFTVMNRGNAILEIKRVQPG